MNKLGDFLKPESMLTGNFVGGSIAGIGVAFQQSLGIPNGWIMLVAAILFGILMATQTNTKGRAMFVVYLLLGTGLGMWEAVQSGTFIESKVVPVSASESSRVFVDRGGKYVAVRTTSSGVEEHRSPAWAVEMYCSYLDNETEQIQKQSPWRIKF